MHRGYTARPTTSCHRKSHDSSAVTYHHPTKGISVTEPSKAKKTVWEAKERTTTLQKRITNEKYSDSCYNATKDTIHLETVVSTVSQKYLLEFTPEYGISEDVHPELPGPEERTVDFSEGKVSMRDQSEPFRNQLPRPKHNSYSKSISCVLRAVIPLRVDERVFPTAVDWRTNGPNDEMAAANTNYRADVAVLNTHMDLFNLISAPNPSKVKTGLRPRAAHEVLLMGRGRPTAVSHTSNLNHPTYMDLLYLISAPNPSKVKTGLRPRVAHEVPLLMATASQVIDLEDPDVAIESSGTPFAVEKSPLDLDNENPSSPMTEGKGTEDQAHETLAPKIPLSGNMPATGFASEVFQDSDRKCGYHGSARHALCEKCRVREIDLFLIRGWITRRYLQPGWGVTNSCRLDTPDACQDVVDHIVPSGYFSELRHMPNAEFLSQYNKKLAQQVVMGSQLRLCFEQEEIQGLRNQTSNLKTLLEAKAGVKKAAKTKNADLTKELESLRTQFLDLQVSHDQLTQQVSTLQTQVTGEEQIKAAFKELKKYEYDRVEKRYADMDVRLDALSIDFNEELYPHMLTVIAGIAKCMSGGLAHGIEHGKAGRGLEVVEAYDPEANIKYLQEMLLEKAIAANVSRAEKKKRCWVVCHTYGIGSAHHARSDGVPVSVPTGAPQGLAILLVDAATQTETSEDDASPRLLRSKSLPPMYNLDWP
uniref:Transposase (Putative), gypsy type n=1 Tax=Tanacetum cinerariifolium TaxID=118510 RepID=A0A699GS43_TANCI|nr:hypothetical protein [Tanacetum cinerariifolium]